MVDKVSGLFGDSVYINNALYFSGIPFADTIYVSTQGNSEKIGESKAEDAALSF